MSMLETAKKMGNVKRKPHEWRTITPEIIELALAWARGEISTASATKVLKYRKGGQQAYTTLARALREHYSKNK